ncbi:hypothetical protein L1D15_11120 [Vibrio sp. Isolate25]|uniref:hypothetical protein n=1 Tax=Vibrio sp. Isolate25 TaxID=2908535 RepID=UPI001EFDA772|nr:hypothetical protein [Vibrio sp. Isolate25]MCG9597265.1 hypothetical protein [Vibrio sp. Isolate25]
MSIPNNQLKTDNQRFAVLCLVWCGVYGGLFEFYGIVGSRLARALYANRCLGLRGKYDQALRVYHKGRKL